MFVVCVVSKDTWQNKAPSADEVQSTREYKKSRWGLNFSQPLDRLRGPPSLLYKGYRVSSPVFKRPGRGVDPNLVPRLKKE